MFNCDLPDGSKGLVAIRSFLPIPVSGRRTIYGVSGPSSGRSLARLWCFLSITNRRVNRRGRRRR